MKLPITDTNAAMLAWIAEWIETKGAAPTVREIAAHEDIQQASIRQRLAILAGRGLIKSAPRARTRERAGAPGGGGVAMTALGLRAVAAYRAGELETIPSGPQPAPQPSLSVSRYLAKDAAGWSLRQIAAHYGVSPAAVQQALDRWRPRAIAQEVKSEARARR